MRFEFSGECDLENEILSRYIHAGYIVEVRLHDITQHPYDAFIEEYDRSSNTLTVQRVDAEGEATVPLGLPQIVAVETIESLYAYMEGWYELRPLQISPTSTHRRVTLITDEVHGRPRRVVRVDDAEIAVL